MKSLQKISAFLTSQTALVVISAAILSFFYPELFYWVKGNAQAAVLGFIMLTMGMTLSTNDFKILSKRPLDIFIGATAQYTLMPLLALALVNIFDLPKGIAVGLLLVGTCPGGVSSNIMSYLAKGDVAFSVGMTTASTLLSPFLTPILMLWISGELVEVNALGMFKSILLVTLMPVAIGSLINFTFGKCKSYPDVIKIMPAFSVLGLVFIVGGVTAYHGEYFFISGISIFFAIFAHNTLGFIFGYIVGKLTKMKTPQCRTISIEVGCQNAGLGTNLASTHFTALPEAAVATAVACVYHTISGSVLANIFIKYDEIKKYLHSRKQPTENDESIDSEFSEE